MDGKADAQLLRDYAEQADEQAFHELVIRYTDLVYSSALRQLSSPELARDVAQSVFTDLARKSREVAAKAANEASLAGWLFRSTRFAALNQLREDRRRLAHERQIMDQLDSSPESENEWDRIRPVLDEAIADLNEADRDALLLRFFKNCDFRAIGESLGVSDDAAQKRVSRALEKLRTGLASRGVTVTVAAIAAVLGANAVMSAPIGLASAFSASALAGAAAVSSATTATVANTIVMTTLQKIAIAAVLTVAVGAGIYQTKKVSDLRRDNQELQQTQEPLNQQIAALEKQRGEASNRVAALLEENEALKKKPTEVLKLRGEVGRLQDEKTTLGRKAALSKVTETPEARKFLRDTQKMGMGMMYAGFAKQTQLPDEKKNALNDLLADYVMDNVDLVTTVLRDKPDSAAEERMFAQLEAGLNGKVQSLLGADALPSYQNYTHDLAAMLTSEQFEGSLAGDQAEKDAKKSQLLNLMREETQTALSNAGLPADFQTVPILNFRNIASETEAEKNLALLDSIYASVEAHGGSFLSPDELKKFEDFRKQAINQSRMQLTMNRAMMAPIGQ
jgi:RNA polymerase sigma factor (sigma-70 family)